MKYINAAAILSLFLILVSCSRSFEPVEYGKEACSYCKMTIVDSRYAAELISQKGKIFKFDDIACMKHFIEENKMTGKDVNLFVADHLKPGIAFINAEKAVYIKHEFFKSPMRGNTAAFANPAEAEKLKDSLNTKVISWDDLKY